MQPPFNFTGVARLDWIILIGGAVVCLYWFRALRLAREGARRFLRHLLKTIILFFGLMAILSAMNPRVQLRPSQELLIAGFIALIFFGRLQSKRRSRYVPKAVRRAVIERDLKGEEFDSTKHHIDHVWPFSRGGSHTVDNLRVIEKKRNLKKAARRPRLRDMW